MQPKSIILFFYGYILFFRRHKLKNNKDKKDYYKIMKKKFDYLIKLSDIKKVIVL